MKYGSRVVIRMPGNRDLDGRVGTVLELMPGEIVKVGLGDGTVRLIPRKFLR